MIPDIKMDLRGIISPLNLLKFKNRLRSMKKGQIIEVILSDRDVSDDLVMITGRSQDMIVYHRQHAGVICIGVKKG